VRVLGAWWERGFDPARADGFVDAMRAALTDYLGFAGATRVEWAPSLGRERRLIGTDPRRAAARRVSPTVHPGIAGTLAPARE